MKRIIGFTLAALTAGTVFIGSLGSSHATASAATEEYVGKSAYLCEYESGTVVYAKNETNRLPIASMCKIMTLLLSFEAVDRGELSYDEKLTVSEKAAGMGGSQVFLGAHLEYSVEELMKSVVVCSANDSCVALAERVAGSEQGFIDRMNARAKELGAENTLFANCTGLPKDPQYSCAKDVSLMLRELLTHQKYFEFSKIWLEDFSHPDGRTTSMTNTNKLVRFYEGCDGGKTGFTNEAGYCLAATAKRGNTRLVAVLIGAETSKSRNASISAMFDNGFGNYETKTFLEGGKELEQHAEIRGGKQKDIAMIAENSLVSFRKRGEEGNYTVDIQLEENLRAPVAQGDVIGRATLYLDGKEVSSTNILAAEEVKKFSWWDAYRESAKNWN